MVTGINTAITDLGTTDTVVAMSASDMAAASPTVTAAPPPPPPPAPPAPPTPSPPAGSSGGGSSGIIVGVVVVMLVVGIAVGAAVWWFKFRPGPPTPTSKPGVMNIELETSYCKENAHGNPLATPPDTHAEEVYKEEAEAEEPSKEETETGTPPEDVFASALAVEVEVRDDDGDMPAEV